MEVEAKEKAATGVGGGNEFTLLSRQLRSVEMKLDLALTVLFDFLGLERSQLADLKRQLEGRLKQTLMTEDQIKEFIVQTWLSAFDRNRCSLREVLLREQEPK